MAAREGGRRLDAADKKEKKRKAIQHTRTIRCNNNCYYCRRAVRHKYRSGGVALIWRNFRKLKRTTCLENEVISTAD